MPLLNSEYNSFPVNATWEEACIMKIRRKLNIRMSLFLFITYFFRFFTTGCYKVPEKHGNL